MGADLSRNPGGDRCAFCRPRAGFSPTRLVPHQPLSPSAGGSRSRPLPRPRRCTPGRPPAAWGLLPPPPLLPPHSAERPLPDPPAARCRHPLPSAPRGSFPTPSPSPGVRRPQAARRGGGGPARGSRGRSGRGRGGRRG